jgi:hypothetical protein
MFQDRVVVGSGALDDGCHLRGLDRFGSRSAAGYSIAMKVRFLRLSESMLEELKLLAHKRDVPYQSLIKIIMSERLEQGMKL